jgi:uncharacterized protein YkwD
MEINNPSGDRQQHWFVTNGLLTIELVTGRLQVGDSAFVQYSSATIPVAGDPDGAGPTYSSFQHLISINGSNRAASLIGQPVTTIIDAHGNIDSAQALPVSLVNTVHNSYYDAHLGHNIPDVFWNWMQKLDDDWVFTMGYPISEPYWSHFTVAGVDRLLLVQPFERRVLTFNASNSLQWQVEMGNIGQHYFNWRYNLIGYNNSSSTPTTNLPDQTVPTSSPISNDTTIPITATPTTFPGTTTETIGNPTPTPNRSTPILPTSNTTTPTITIPTSPIITTIVVSPTTTISPTVTISPPILSAEEQQFLNLINQYRQTKNLPTWSIEPTLELAAQWMSKDMASHNYFSHIDSLGRNYSARFAAFGYINVPQNETILAGADANTTFDAWKASSADQAILVNPSYKVAGVGFSYNAKSNYHYYWVVDIGGS